MLHTYRDPKVLARRERQPFDVGLGRRRLPAHRVPDLRTASRRSVASCAARSGVDDAAGTCELETSRESIALHVNEITSIEYERDGESMSEYDVRAAGRKGIPE